MQEEVLGELAFNHYYHVLSEMIGVDFNVRWVDLNYCEQRAWIETAKTICEVMTQLRGETPKMLSLTLAGISCLSQLD